MPGGMEFFRATFGAAIPCTAREVVLAPDSLGCVNTQTYRPQGWENFPSAIATRVSIENGRQTVLENYNPLELDPYGIRGRYVVAYRGSCPFTTKARYVQNAGGAGLIVINTEPGLLRMPGAPSTKPRSAKSTNGTISRSPVANASDLMRDAGVPGAAHGSGATGPGTGVGAVSPAITLQGEIIRHHIPAVMVSKRSGETLRRALASRYRPVLAMQPTRADCVPGEETSTASRDDRLRAEVDAEMGFLATREDEGTADGGTNGGPGALPAHARRRSEAVAVLKVTRAEPERWAPRK